ncbi:MAG: (2Fe-2S)-binding protein [Gemmatimonadaceae bacterium]|nr:(2Fe-2S)-binding protein [Gloeobacterales cyanobacterium ES-bin-141]
MVTIHFEDDHSTIEVKANQSLTDICDEYPNSLLFGCRDAACGTCLIEVTSGIENISPVTENERDMLDVMAEDNPRARLACQCVVLGDIRMRALK